MSGAGWRGRERGRGLSRAVCLVLILAAAVVLVALAPSGYASPHPGIVKKHPPVYKVFNSVIHTNGCGASASFPVPPSYSAPTGVGRVKETATATGCGIPLLPDDASAKALVHLVTLPITSTVGDWGVPVTFGVKLDFNVSYNLSATPWPAGFVSPAWATYRFALTLALWNDSSNGTMFNSTYGLLDTGTTNGTATGILSGVASGPVNLARTTYVCTGCQYSLLLIFQLLVIVHAPGGTTDFADGTVDMATPPDVLTLHSFSLT